MEWKEKVSNKVKTFPTDLGNQGSAYYKSHNVAMSQFL